MEKTSHNITRLEEYLNQGYKEVSRTQDKQWVVLENLENRIGIVYDLQRNLIITEYKFEIWRR